MDNLTSGDKKNIVKLAHMFFHDGQWDKALIEYRKILALDQDNMNTLNTLGDIYLKKNSIQSAYESYAKAADGFLSRGQADKAILVYKKIIKLDIYKISSDDRTKINLAQCCVKIDEALKEEQIETAIEMLGKVLKFHLADPMVKAKLMELDSKIAQMPVSIQQYQTLGNIFLKNDIFEKAQEMFKKITEIDPRNLAVRLNLIQVYLKQDSENEAKKEYLNLAEEALAKDDLEQAFEFSQKAIELKSLEAYYISGLVYFKRQKWSEAIVEFEKLLRIKVGHVGGLLHLGKSLDRLGRLEKATETFHKALKIDKDNPHVQEAWIEFCIRCKDKEMAIPNLMVLLDKAVTDNNADRIAKFSKMLIQLEPNLVFPRVKLIEALQTLGDLDGAADIYCALSLIHERQNQFQDAVKCLEKALELSPVNTEVLEKSLAEMRRKASGVQTLPSLTVIEKNSISPKSLVSADFFHPFKTESEEAFVEPQAVSVPVPLNAFEAQMVTAAACMQQGLFKAAIEIYQQLLETNPGLTDVRKKLNEANDIYLKKWMEAKLIDAGKNSPFLLSPSPLENKINTNY